MTNEELNKIVEERTAEFKAKLLAELQAEKEWPQAGDKFWFVSGASNIKELLWGGGVIQKGWLSLGRIHPTKKQAEFVRDMERERGYKYWDVLYRLQQFADEVNGDWAPDWTNKEQRKYCIGIDHDKKVIDRTLYHYMQFSSLPAFRKDVTKELNKRFSYKDICHVMGGGL